MKTQKQHIGQKTYVRPPNRVGGRVGSKRNQHRNNKDSDFYRTNIVNFICIQQKIKNMLEYRSDPFGNILNLHFFFKHLQAFK